MRLRAYLANRLGNPVTGTLTVIGAICGAFLGLQCVAREVLEGETLRFDEAVLLALRHAAIPVRDRTGLDPWRRREHNQSRQPRDHNARHSIHHDISAHCRPVDCQLLSRRRRYGRIADQQRTEDRSCAPKTSGRAHLATVNDFSFPADIQWTVLCLALALLAGSMQADRTLKSYPIAAGVPLAFLIGISRSFWGCITRPMYLQDGVVAQLGRFSVGCPCGGA